MLLSSNVAATDGDKLMAEIEHLKQIQSMKGLKKTEKFRKSRNDISKFTPTASGQCLWRRKDGNTKDIDAAIKPEVSPKNLMKREDVVNAKHRLDYSTNSQTRYESKKKFLNLDL